MSGQTKMETNPIHYLSPKLEARQAPEKGSFGVFAVEAVEAGELLTVWGGRVVDLETLRTLPPKVQQYTLQVDEGLYLAPTTGGEPADYFNHCCDPNAGLRGQVSLVALRDIGPGEEVCFDYAMCDGSPYDEFECACGAPNCRGRVTGEDWRLPELQERYRGHFSPYLQARIEQEKNSPRSAAGAGGVRGEEEEG